MKTLFLIISLFFCVQVSGQRLKGTVRDENNKPLQVSLLIKDIENIELIKEFFISDENGNFDVQLQEKQPKIIFELRAMGYGIYADSLLQPESDKTYTFSIQLKPAVLELEEVVIASTRKVVVKKDTTEYFPKAFLDGTERKAEDLLKHLPGMEVKENGELKYFGKPVESVQLDGDDLFGSRYALGTKNIAVDLIEKVQAIDNFNANPFLKDMVESKTVSLNLVLKKTKTKLNIDGDIGLGLGNGLRKDIGLNLLAFNNRFKSFGNITHNNVGKNYGMYDYFGGEEAKENSKFSQEIISETNFSDGLAAEQARINNDISGSYNSLFRLNKKTILKSYLNYSKESLQKEEWSIADFFLENIRYDDYKKSTRKPTNIEIGAKIEHTATKNLLIFESGLRKENIISEADILQNQTNQISTNLQTKSWFWNNELNYTLKLHKRSAWQWKSIYAQNNLPQNLYFNANFLPLLGDRQEIENQKQHTENQLLFFYAKDATKLNLVLGNVLAKHQFKSDLWQNNKNIEGFKNDFQFHINQSFFDVNMIWKRAAWELKPSLKATQYEQKVAYFSDNVQANQGDFALSPTVNLAFVPNGLHKVFVLSRINYEPNSLQNIFLNKIMESPRSLKNNILSLSLQKSEEHSLNYRFNEPFLFFSTLLGFSYKKDYNTYLNNVRFNDNFSTITYFRSPTNVENSTIFLGLDKLLSDLGLSVKYSSVFSFFNYKNVVNESDLRSNQSISQNHNLFLKGGFSSIVSLENFFTFNTSQSWTDGAFNNKINGFTNTFKVIGRPNKSLMLVSSLQIVTPNVNQKQFYRFLDLTVSLKPKKKDSKIGEYRLIGKNLLNMQFYKNVDNNDFMISQYQTNLLPRYVMVYVGFRL